MTPSRRIYNRPMPKKSLRSTVLQPVVIFDVPSRYPEYLRKAPADVYAAGMVLMPNETTGTHAYPKRSTSGPAKKNTSGQEAA